jgi:hypothetical protein
MALTWTDPSGEAKFTRQVGSAEDIALLEHPQSQGWVARTAARDKRVRTRIWRYDGG